VHVALALRLVQYVLSSAQAPCGLLQHGVRHRFRTAEQMFQNVQDALFARRSREALTWSEESEL
jgi:hypothetical protein